MQRILLIVWWTSRRGSLGDGKGACGEEKLLIGGFISDNVIRASTDTKQTNFQARLLRQMDAYGHCTKRRGYHVEPCVRCRVHIPSIGV